MRSTPSIKPGDLVQILTEEEASTASKIYEDWLGWDPSHAGKIGIAMIEEQIHSNTMQVMIDFKAIWIPKVFVRKCNP